MVGSPGRAGIADRMIWFRLPRVCPTSSPRGFDLSTEEPIAAVRKPGFCVLDNGRRLQGTGLALTVAVVRVMVKDRATRLVAGRGSNCVLP